MITLLVTITNFSRPRKALSPNIIGLQLLDAYVFYSDFDCGNLQRNRRAS